MKKSIKKQIIARILSEPYESANHLINLSSVINEREAYENDSEAELKEQFLPSIYYFFKEEKIESVNIDTITKIANDIEKVLIKKINITALKKNKKTFYKLISLLLALDYLSDCKPLKDGKIIKNYKVQLCYDLIYLVEDANLSKEEIKKWFDKRLKKLRFN